MVDGPFNTNSLRLPLLIAVGITNSGKTVPVAFSYCPSGSKESYNFFFQSLKEEASAGDIQSVKVVVGDPAGGLIASLDPASPSPTTLHLLNSLLATLTQFLRRFGGTRRFMDLLMLQD